VHSLESKERSGSKGQGGSQEEKGCKEEEEEEEEDVRVPPTTLR